MGRGDCAACTRRFFEFFPRSFRLLFLMTSLAETATIRCAPARHYLLAARSLMQPKMLTGIRLRRQVPILQNSSEFPNPRDTFSPPTLLQPNSELVFEVELLKIGDEAVSEGGCAAQAPLKTRSSTRCTFPYAFKARRKMELQPAAVTLTA